MKTTFKFAGLSALLFGQSLCLLAQTAWHNPAADSLLPIQGRAWNAETGKAYQRLPQLQLYEYQRLTTLLSVICKLFGPLFLKE